MLASPKVEEVLGKKMGREGVFISQCIVNMPLVIQVGKLCLKLGLASVVV